jgi:DNA processing protein
MTALPACGSSTVFGLLVTHDAPEAFERAVAHAQAKLGRPGVDDGLVEKVHADCVDAGVEVITVRDARFPMAVAGHPQPCGVLFVRGNVEVLSTRRVGVVGTRTPTPSGVYTAREIGEGLARAGVAVVSGLAKGIDGAAHDGMRPVVESRGPDAGRPIAVVGSGPDVVYPKSNAALWEWVCAEGVLLSEFRPGVSAEPHHFPRRNRLIAALSEVVVVVESRAKGGSMSTVRQAIERQRDVLAVPGSPRVASAAGTNLLIQQGCGVVTCAADILSALSLDHSRTDVNHYDVRPVPEPRDIVVLDACSHGPVTLDHLLIATGRDLAALATSLGRLQAAGWVMEDAGWWEALLLRRGRHTGDCIS